MEGTICWFYKSLNRPIVYGYFVNWFPKFGIHCPGIMLLLILGLTWSTTSVYGVIPPSNVFYQHMDIPSACVYGNLTVAVTGKTFKPQDCNTHISVKDLEHPPFLYINSTNSTERFTVIMVDLGSQGRGPDYLMWMITNVSINTLPSYQTIPPNNVLVSYQAPLMMHGFSQQTLIQILVLRHQNVLRIPFGELWVTRRRNFALSTLFSNTSPNLRLCGPVAGTQYWVHDNLSNTQSAAIPAPSPVYVPVVPVQQAYPPTGPVAGQPPYSTNPGQVANNQDHPHKNFPKKSLGAVPQPINILFIPLALIIIFL